MAMQTTTRYTRCLITIDRKQTSRDRVIKLKRSRVSVFCINSATLLLVDRTAEVLMRPELRLRKTNQAAVLQRAQRNQLWMRFDIFPHPLDLPTVKKGQNWRLLARSSAGGIHFHPEVIELKQLISAGTRLSSHPPARTECAVMAVNTD